MERTRPKIIIADDQPLVAELCKTLLENEFEIVGIATDGRDLIQAAIALRPDVIVVDVAMPVLNGLDAAERVKQMLPSVKVIFLTMNPDPEVAAEAFRRGASGYLLKTSAATEMVTSVREVLRGKTYLSPRISKNAVAALHKNLVEETENLTQRQREILQLLAEGKSMQEIASSSGAAKGAGKAGFAVKKPGSEDIDAWIKTNWEAAAEEPLFKFGLLSGSTHVALAIAVRVARDRWTAADDKRYSAAFKKMIFEWADEIGKIPKAVAGIKRALAGRKRNGKKVH